MARLEILDTTTTSDTRVETQQESSFQEYLTILLRGKWVILLTFIAATAATAVFTFLARPVYESASMVLIDMKSNNNGLPFLDITGMANTNKITNELETLKSRSMAEAVAGALLSRQYLDDSHTRIIPIIRAMVNGKLLDQPGTLQEVTLRLIKSVDFTPIRDSDIIKITARSHDPEEAALLANIYTEVYAGRNLSTSRIKSKAIREFLQAQMSEKHQALDTTEHALQGYMRSSGMVSLDGESDQVVKQLSDLEATRDGLEVEISTRTRTLNSYKEELEKQEPNVAKAMGESADAYIKLLQEQLAKLEVQRDVVIAQNRTMSGDKLYAAKLKEIDSQITSLKQNLKDRTKVFLGTLIPGEPVGDKSNSTAGFLGQVKQRIIEQQIELDGLSARKEALAGVITDYERKFNQIPEKSIELAKLQRARLSSEKLYLLVEEKFNEAAITETSEFGYVNIMDPAVIPIEQVSPRVVQNIVLGALVGLFLGIATVLARARVDDRIRTPEDLKRHGFAALSTISRMDIAKRNGSSGQPAPRGEPGIDEHVVTCLNPFSPMAEAYRHLRTNVQFALPDKTLKTMLVTSASPKEGKSTTISNLAAAFAQTENRVLLIDADMRRPTIHSVFGLVKDPGLTDVLFNRGKLEEVVNKQVVDNLDVLCCGTTPPNPAEILGSRRMKEFIAYVSGIYDIVLFDCPPLLAVTDSAVLARSVDGAVLVVSAGSTTVSAIQRAAESLGSVGMRPLGVVLNNFDVRSAYGGYYGSYRYGHYGYGYSPSTDPDGSAKKRDSLAKAV